MDIQDEIIRKIVGHEQSYLRKPSVILMTPANYKLLAAELNRLSNKDYANVTNPKFMGIRIIRSLDTITIEVF